MLFSYLAIGIEIANVCFRHAYFSQNTKHQKHSSDRPKLRVISRMIHL